MDRRAINTTAVKSTTCEAIAAELAPYGILVEVGIGRRTDLAAALAEPGTQVTATDIYPCEVPDTVGFVRDDINDPAIGVYTDAEAIYALNLPPELHRSVQGVARRVGADFLFTTLGGDPPQVPVSRRMVPDDTLFVDKR